MLLENHVYHFCFFSFTVLILTFRGGPITFLLKILAEVCSRELT